MGKANRIGKNILLALISAVFISPIVIVFLTPLRASCLLITSLSCCRTGNLL